MGPAVVCLSSHRHTEQCRHRGSHSVLDTRQIRPLQYLFSIFGTRENSACDSSSPISMTFKKRKISKTPSTKNMGLLYGDLFSYLPENLLSLIISFLPFKEAATTSILSKKWRYVFLTHFFKTMDFDEKWFLDETQGSDDISKKKQRRAFLGFVRRCVELSDNQESDTNKFRLAFSRPDNHYLDLQQFILFGLSRKPKSLDLDFSNPLWNEENAEMFQTYLFLPVFEGHEMLESLKLYSCNIPTIFYGLSTFSALKNLSLGWIRICSGSLRSLLSKCPNLEILSLKKCWNIGYFEIKAPRLRKLVLDKCFPPRFQIILVNAPKLQSFVYCGLLTGFQFERSYSLEEAFLELTLEEEFDEMTCSDWLCFLLYEIGNVKTLTVCSYTLQAIPCGEMEPPALHNVRHLTLMTALHLQEFYGITFFLKSCRHLEVLTIDLTPPKLIPDYDPPFKGKYHVFIHDNQFLQFHCVRKALRSIEVNGFKGVPNELVVLKYLLKHGMVLETLFIRLSSETGRDGISMKAEYEEKARSLFRFERACKSLRILISSLP